jgi:2-polyprenyl-3-methyl-5-hydroxy-6-metoxy-1,4-benzoquinol methylase
MELSDVERVIREHGRREDQKVLDLWLTRSTLSRFRDWVPAPAAGETTLMDIGCYQPTIGYYAALGWTHVIGVAKEKGECNSPELYSAPVGVAVVNLIVDIEKQRIRQNDESVDVVLMMEIFEHFGLDPMHALTEANRVLKYGGLLVLSTPNATSFAGLYRMMLGKEPHGGLEFSGYSSNRHNRIYDSDELREFLGAAGFEVEMLTSSTYERNALPPKAVAFRFASGLLDRFVSRRDGRQIERGEFLFLKARKRSKVQTRFPKRFYFDPSQFPEWFENVQREAV